MDHTFTKIVVVCSSELTNKLKKNIKLYECVRAI